jgi:hypothetical protein
VRIGEKPVLGYLTHPWHVSGTLARATSGLPALLILICSCWTFCASPTAETFWSKVVYARPPRPVAISQWYSVVRALCQPAPICYRSSAFSPDSTGPRLADVSGVSLGYHRGWRGGRAA